MMARSTKAPFKGRIQKRKTNHLQIITFGLQRTAGPYKGANNGPLKTHQENLELSIPNRVARGCLLRTVSLGSAYLSSQRGRIQSV